MPHPILLIATLVISIPLIIYSWIHRSVQGSLPFLVFLVGAVEWNFCTLMARLLQEQAQMWFSLQLGGVMIVPSSLLLFALQYTERNRWITPRSIALLSIMPLLTWVLAATNDFHSLIWILPFEHSNWGPWLTAAVYYNRLIFVLGLVLLARLWLTSHEHRSQLGIILVGLIPPLVADIMFGLKISPVSASYLFAVPALCIGFALFRLRFLDLVPIARDVIIEEMSDGIVVIDEQERIVDLNPSAEKLFGLKAIARGTRWLGLSFQNSISGSETTFGAGDAQRIYESRISKLHSKDGAPIGRLIVLHDVTERKRMEDELLRATALAEERSQATEAFMARIIHDLTPPIQGFFNVIDDASWRPEQAALKQLIESQAVLLQDFVSQARSYVQAKTVHLQFSYVPLSPICAAAASAALPRAQRRKVLVTQEQDLDAEPMVWGNATAIRRILDNLLSNAIDISPAGGEVTLRVTPSEAAWIQVAVQDQGPGIPEEKQALIFEPCVSLPLSRLTDPDAENDYPRSPTGTGLGLGLAIVKELTCALGGQYGVESAQGQGSTFYVRMPARPPQDLGVAQGEAACPKSW